MSSTVGKAFEIARPLRRHNPITFLQTCRSKSSYATHTRPKITQPVTSSTSSNTRNTIISRQTRPFSRTARAQATVVRQNPRVDDDGNGMQIEISERAAKRLRQITSSAPKKNTLTSSASTPSDSHLRVSVTSGGCHGFQYLMSLESADKIDQDEDTVFEFADSSSEKENKSARAEVVMDQASLELLKGSTVDFTTELIGSQFKIVGNPRATSSCGCGTSFDIE